MTAEKTKTTSAEFWEFVNADENYEKSFERINGEIIEIMPSGAYSSIVANLISAFVTNFVLKHDLGTVSGADGGYEMSDEDTFGPDMGFIAKGRLPIPFDGFYPEAPDFAVEVVSPSDLEHPKERIEKKLNKYKALRIPLLWYVYPNRKEVEVYEVGQLVRVVGIDETLDGGSVLPGFTFPMRDIFPN